MLKLIQALNGAVERLTSKQLLCIAVIVNIFMALLVNLVLTGIGAEKPVQVAQANEGGLRKVVVAKVPIKGGTIIDSSMLEVVEFSALSVPYGATQDIYAFQNLPAKVDIMPGDVVTDLKIFREVRQTFAEQLPDNCKAVTVKVDGADVESLTVGELVDVVLKAGDDATDDVLLRDVLLLGVNAVNANHAEATLALQPDEILKVATAAKHGTALTLQPVTPESTETFVNEPVRTYEPVYSVPPREVPATVPEPKITAPTAAAQPSLPIIPSGPAPALPLPDIPNVSTPDVSNKPSSEATPGGIDVVEWGK